MRDSGFLYSVFKARVNHKRGTLAINIHSTWDVRTDSLLHCVILSQSFPLIEKRRRTGNGPQLYHYIDSHFGATWQRTCMERQVGNDPTPRVLDGVGRGPWQDFCFREDRGRLGTGWQCVGRWREERPRVWFLM